MSKRIGKYLRQQHLALVTMFLVLCGGTAYALEGSNTVFSDDITNGQVRSPDILDGTVGKVDLLDGAIDGSKVQNNGLGGADIAEQTLGEVPSALTAVQGGVGRFGYSAGCDPESATYVPCATVNVTLAAPGRLLVNAIADATTELGANNAFGECRIGSTAGTVPGTDASVHFRDGGDDTYATHSVALTGITSVFPAGTYTLGIDCNQTGYGAIYYHRARISVVALSAA